MNDFTEYELYAIHSALWCDGLNYLGSPQPPEGHVQCSNPEHPRGAWHVATPLPFFTLFRMSRPERRYRKNVRRYGCGCD